MHYCCCIVPLQIWKQIKLYGFSGVQIVDVCLATRPHNGGLINLEELCKLLSQRRKGAREVVSEDDCLRAIGKLKVLYLCSIQVIRTVLINVLNFVMYLNL